MTANAELDRASVSAQLAAQEPIFHRPRHASSLADFDRLMSPGYWETGASGRRYDRDFILQHLQRNPPVDAETAGWQILDPECRPLGTDTFLFTYTLHQGDRHTRRATIWQRTAESWQILYHQGTIIA